MAGADRQDQDRTLRLWELDWELEAEDEQGPAEPPLSGGLWSRILDFLSGQG